MEVQVIEKIKGRIDRTTGLQINRKLKVAAYKILCSNKDDIVNKFITRINSIMTENSLIKLIENMETEKEKLKSKMNKLIDLSLDKDI